MASSEKKVTLFLLCYFFGCFGLHRFYTGKYVSGIVMLCTLGGLGLWMFVDLARILMGKFRDREGNLITEWR